MSLGYSPPFVVLLSWLGFTGLVSFIGTFDDTVTTEFRIFFGCSIILIAGMGTLFVFLDKKLVPSREAHGLWKFLCFRPKLLRKWSIFTGFSALPSVLLLINVSFSIKSAVGTISIVIGCIVVLIYKTATEINEGYYTNYKLIVRTNSRDQDLVECVESILRRHAHFYNTCPLSNKQDTWFRPLTDFKEYPILQVNGEEVVGFSNIFQILGDQFGLDGFGIKEHTFLKNMLEKVMTTRRIFYNINDNEPKLLRLFKKRILIEELDVLEKLICVHTESPFILGNYATYVDFVLNSLLSSIVEKFPNLLARSPNLDHFHDNFEEVVSQ